MTSAAPPTPPAPPDALSDQLQAVAAATGITVPQLLAAGPDQPSIGLIVRACDPPYPDELRWLADELVPGVTRAEAVVAAACAMLHGGFTTPEIEAPRLAHDRQRARTAEPFAAGDQPGASVRDLTPRPVGQLPGDDDEPPPLPIGKIKRYQALHDEKVRLEAELGAVKKEKAELEAELVEAYAESQTNNATIAGRPTFLRRQVVASKKPGVTTPELVKALRECGLDHLITTDTVSASTLSGYVRDLDKADQELPPPLAAVVAPYEKYEIIIHAATNGRSK